MTGDASGPSAPCLSKISHLEKIKSFKTFEIFVRFKNVLFLTYTRACMNENIAKGKNFMFSFSLKSYLLFIPHISYTLERKNSIIIDTVLLRAKRTMKANDVEVDLLQEQY